MRPWVALLLAVGSAWAQQPLRRAALPVAARVETSVVRAAVPVTRVSLAGVEKMFDTRVSKLRLEEPFYLLAFTRGIYLPQYGVLFTNEVNLVATAPVSPFRQAYTKEEVAKLHARKAERLPTLRQGLREMMGEAAAMLDTVPLDERIVVAASLFYFNWEDMTSLPSQIVMQSTRRSLLAAKGDRVGLEQAIQVTEY